jgi:flagellin-like protein
MKLNELFADDDAVSPVIGVILMVAITVILAAVIGTFVLGLGSEVQETPAAQFTFDETGSNSITITHDGGDPIDATNMEVTGAGVSDDACSTAGEWAGDSEVDAGDSCDVSPSSDGTIRVTWTSADGSTSDTLATYDYSS